MDNPRDRKAFRQVCVAASARQLNKMLHDTQAIHPDHAAPADVRDAMVRTAIIETVAENHGVQLRPPPPACCTITFTAGTVSEAEGLIIVTTYCNRPINHRGPHALEHGALDD